MRSEWIVDVLADLKAYAEQNGLAATAAGLEDAALVALAEISSLQAQQPGGGTQATHSGHEQEAGNVTPLFAHRGLT